MNQRSYIEEVPKCFNMEECKPVGTLFNANIKLLKLSNEEFGNVNMEIGVPYNVRVGSLMYAMIDMKANIAFVVSAMSQFMSKVGPPQWMAMKRIMRYLKGILDFKSCLGHKDIFFERILQCRLGGRCKRLALHHKVYVFC